jgi:hypothetical protein
LRLSRTELSPSRIETKCRRAFPPVTAGAIASPLMCLHKDQIVRIGADAMHQACVFTRAKSGSPRRIKRTSPSVESGPTPRSRRVLTQAKSGPSRRIKRTSCSVKSGPAPRSSRALTQAKSGPYAASSELRLRSNRDQRHAPGVCLLRPNRGLTPHQADFTFGQIGTDATLQACAYSGQIGALRRIKRASPSVTMISDRLGLRALEAVWAVTYPAEGHFEDYAPTRG